MTVSACGCVLAAYAFFILDNRSRISKISALKGYRLAWTGGIRSRQGISRSSELANRISEPSSPNLAMNCIPIGKPDWLCPRGNVMAGCPVTFAAEVNTFVSSHRRMNPTKSTSVRIFEYFPRGSGSLIKVGVSSISYCSKNFPKVLRNLFKANSVIIISAAARPLEYL